MNMAGRKAVRPINIAGAKPANLTENSLYRFEGS